MRRLVFPVILASGLVIMGAVPAYAEPAPAATSAKAAAGKKICKITDPLLPELSGMVATKSGFIVVNDSADEARRRKVFFLDTKCAVTKQVDFPSRTLDTEDLVLAPDGNTLWIADTGDNAARENKDNVRRTIALWSMPLSGAKEPTIHRVTYPNGDKHDAEALLFSGDGTPIIVTKEVSGKTLLYTPTAALKKNTEAGVPLKKAGEIALPGSDTPGVPIARLAQTAVTGGAVAPGGGRVTLRTYLDAYEWDVADGDVLGALKNKPRKTPLPNEPFGEAITYSADGKTFYTVSDMGSGADPESANYILRYTPATKIVEAKSAAAAAEGATDGASWYSDLSLTDITYLIGGVGVLGLLLVGAGVFGIVQSRKKRKLEPVLKDPEPTGPDPLDAATELLSVGGPAQRPGAFGGNGPPVGAASAPGVYGGKPAPAAPVKGDGVYGGKPAPAAPVKGDGVYGGGRPPQGGQPAGRPPQGGQPAGRPGQGGQPAGRPAGGRPGVPPTVPGAPPAGPGGGAPARPGQPGGGRPGQPGGRPAQPAGRPPQGGQPGGRPGQGGQPAGRPPQGGQPAGRPGQGGQPAGRPGQGGQPAGGPGQGGRPGQPGRPGPAGQPGRSGPAGQPAGGPGQGGRPGQPGRPGPAGQPGPSGQPGRPGQGGQPAARPVQPPARPAQGGQPAARPVQPPARPAQGGPPGGGRPGKGGGGVYGAPPPPPPPTGRPPSGGPPRPTGFLGQGGGQQGGGGQRPARPDSGRQANGMNNYANLNGAPGRGDGRFDNPGYGGPTGGR